MLRKKPKTHKKGRCVAATVLLLAAVLLLVPVSGCGSGGGELTDSETSVPTVTSADTDISGLHTGAPRDPDTDPSGSIVLSPERFGESFSLICESGAPDVFLLSQNAGILTEKYGVTPRISTENDLFTAVKTAVDSGSDENMDLLLPTAQTAMRLTTAGYLQDLSEAGIGIKPESRGVNSGLTSDVNVFGGVYLLFCDGLTSDVTASYGVIYRPGLVTAGLFYDPLSMIFSGQWTLADFITCANYAGTYASLGGFSGLTMTNDATNRLMLLGTFGGKLYTVNEKGLPELSSVDEESDLFRAYTDTLSLLNAVNPPKPVSTPVMEITKINPVRDGEIYLPLPFVEGTVRTPVDTAYCSVFAVPRGIAGGKRTAAIIAAWCDVTGSGARKTLIRSVYSDAVANGKAITELIFNRQTADPALLLGWGDFDDLFSAGLDAGTPLKTLTEDRTFSDRKQALVTAVGIVAGRLGRSGE